MGDETKRDAPDALNMSLSDFNAHLGRREGDAGNATDKDLTALARAPGAPSNAVVTDVVVFGGGITGMTVAHELAERNYRVTVVEPAYEGDSPLCAGRDVNPGLGGVARSQWGHIANKATDEDMLQSPLPAKQMLRAWSLPFRLGPLELSYEIKRVEAATEREAAVEEVDLEVDEGKRAGIRLLLIAMTMISDCKLTFRHRFAIPEHAKHSAALLAAASRLLDEVRAGGSEPGMARLHLAPDELDMFIDKVDSPLEGSVVLELNVFDLPGEHGFRFFPSFYRHLFDMMRRIPATVTREEGNGRGARRGRDTVFDNLVSVGSVGYVGKAAGPTATIPRRRIRSFEEARKVLSELLRETGYSTADLLRLSLKVWQYMTSSRLRRETEYEDMSWYEFVEGDRFSERGRFLLESTPGTLGGLFGSEADARTQGTILLQCMRDQFTDDRESDKLLNGPTDEAWFGHWHRYLLSQGVRFERGTLKDFEVVDQTIAPVVLKDPDGARDDANRWTFSPKGRPQDARPAEEQQVFYVLALPLIPAHELAERFVACANQIDDAARRDTLRDFTLLKGFPRKTNKQLRDDMALPYPTGPLRHLSGIQYFFNQELRLAGSHTLYLDAPSGLTAIAQPQYWMTPRNFNSGFRSVLSVDIAIWAPMPGRSTNDWHAWGKSRREIANTIWSQITSGHAGDYPDEWPKLPMPTAFHIDDNLVFSQAEDAVLVDDKTPFLVNEKGRFRSRPGGEPDRDDPTGVRIEYKVALGQYVLAGTFMQTRTRINSMEAACESGRHAVNAILRHLKRPGDPCVIWDPESFEDESLDPDKEIDEQLCKKGMPHMGSILGVDRIDTWLPRDGAKGVSNG